MAVKHCFKMPRMLKITGRISTITNVFAQAIIPEIYPTEKELADALEVLELDADDLRCVYCGDKATEWEHLRPLIKDNRPTGYISEIGNLVPSCNKCNTSKGGRDWREWMLGNAQNSPTTRNLTDVEVRLGRIEEYVGRFSVHKIDFEAIVGSEMWAEHWNNWKKLLDTMKTSQELAAQLKQLIAEGYPREQQQ